MEAIRIKAKKELARIMELPINKETLMLTRKATSVPRGT